MSAAYQITPGLRFGAMTECTIIEGWGPVAPDWPQVVAISSNPEVNAFAGFVKRSSRGYGFVRLWGSCHFKYEIQISRKRLYPSRLLN